MMVREACPEDDYLDTIHSLMLMDDTALLATTRERLLKRYDALVRFCEEYDMVINEDNKCELLWTCDKLQWTYHNSAKFKATGGGV